jgi:hypothetical protein
MNAVRAVHLRSNEATLTGSFEAPNLKRRMSLMGRY